MRDRELDELDLSQRSRVRCDGFWYEVLEAPPDVTELLDHGAGDWVELSGAADGRPIWLVASLVDYVEAVGPEDELEGDVISELMGLMPDTGGARCIVGVRRHVGSGGTMRSQLRARSARWWI